VTEIVIKKSLTINSC